MSACGLYANLEKAKPNKRLKEEEEKKVLWKNTSRS